jgi:hypothetical protein
MSSDARPATSAQRGRGHGADPRRDPARRRRIALTAVVLGAVAVGFYGAFIAFTAAQG